MNLNSLKVRIFILTIIFSIFSNASTILINDMLKKEVVSKIEIMAKELSDKAHINGYVIATNEPFKVGFNLVKYSKNFETNMTKPYVLLIFAPQSLITHKSKDRGRVAIISSSKKIKKMYNYSDVLDSVIDVIAVKDSNIVEDKHNIGVLQGFSELCDEIADNLNIELKTTIPNDTKYFIFLLKILVYIGSILVLWMFMIRPIIMRIKNGKK